MKTKELQRFYLELTNNILPQEFKRPISENHCFQRVILDYIFKDCWYNHLDTYNKAYKQLSEEQLINAVNRMQAWLNKAHLLELDNNNSLSYRNGRK